MSEHTPDTPVEPSLGHAGRSPRPPTKYVFVTGGVASALGKGITAASLGRLLKARGLSVTMQKLDPYLNVDPGTMNPFEHGEVFVTDDGGETDLDLGHYERFVDVSLGRGSSVSSGQVWSSVIAKERRGDYLGKTVQVIPHVTNEIKHRIEQVGRSLADSDDGGRPVDVVIVEVGGTVGDIEGLPFLEAIRQFRYDVGRDNLCYVHCALVPYIAAAGELKTKPAQHSVRELRSIGIQPDVVVLRADRELDEGLKRKVAMLCDVDTDAVVGAVDQASLYEVPLAMRAEGLDEVVARRLALPPAVPDLTDWEALVERVQSLRDRVRIGVVGKYVELPDAYLSVAEALRHAGFAHGVDVDVDWIASDDLDADNAWARLRQCDGILVPGGFGVRGIEGKVEAVRLAREHEVPFLGICLGLQVACIEFARNVAGLTFASSSEFDPNAPDLVIDLMADQVEVTDMGGTMRLGAYPARLVEGTRTRAAYGREVVYERHRHRFEFANAYREVFRQSGMVFSGLSPDGRLVEFIELPDHPWFVGTQAHPELKSRPNRPHPLFSGFVAAAKERAGQLQGRLPTFDVVGLPRSGSVDPIDEPTAAEVREALTVEASAIPESRP